MGWLTNTIDKVKSKADATVKKVAPKQLQGTIDKVNAVTDQAWGFAKDPWRGKKSAEASAEQAKEDALGNITSQIEGLDEYQISDYANERMALLEQSGEDLISGAEDATSIARMRAGMAEAPGAGQAARDIEASSAAQIQSMQQMGGAGVLGAATQVGLTEDAAYDDMIKGNMAYKEQSQDVLAGALTTEAGMRQQAAGLQAQGLQGMIAEEDKVFQSQQSNAQQGIQWDMSQLAMDEQTEAASQSQKFLGLF